MKTLEAMTREERSLLLFLESCAVDNIGRVKVKHMSVEDMNIAVRWNKEGFLKFGRIYSKDVTEAGSHWCILTDEAWQLASEERKARAKRTLSEMPIMPGARRNKWTRERNRKAKTGLSKLRGRGE